ncbi:MAG: hypothetical protein Q4F30_02250 [Akkermansia sp.]|nr:hypothetical protein [Akkermansia sp.]
MNRQLKKYHLLPVLATFFFRNVAEMARKNAFPAHAARTETPERQS